MAISHEDRNWETRRGAYLIEKKGIRCDFYLHEIVSDGSWNKKCGIQL